MLTELPGFDVYDGVMWTELPGPEVYHGVMWTELPGFEVCDGVMWTQLLRSAAYGNVMWTDLFSIETVYTGHCLAGVNKARMLQVYSYSLIRSKRSTAPKFRARSKILNKCQVALCFCQRKAHVFERAKRAVL